MIESELSKFEFHGSSISKYFMKDQNFYLEFEDVTRGEESVDLTVALEIGNNGIASIEGFLSNGYDGEVLDLSFDNQNVELLVEWKKYQPNEEITRSHKLNLDSIVEVSVDRTMNGVR